VKWGIGGCQVKWGIVVCVVVWFVVKDVFKDDGPGSGGWG